MFLKKLDNINFNNFPVAIFGTGPAGITVALELEKKKYKMFTDRSRRRKL